jgi:hypothetical protein
VSSLALAGILRRLSECPAPYAPKKERKPYYETYETKGQCERPRTPDSGGTHIQVGVDGQEHGLVRNKSKRIQSCSNVIIFMRRAQVISLATQ